MSATVDQAAEAMDLIEQAREALREAAEAPTEVAALAARTRARILAGMVERALAPTEAEPLSVGLVITHESAVELMALDAIGQTYDAAEDRFSWAEDVLGAARERDGFTWVTRPESPTVVRLTPAPYGRWIMESQPR